MGHARLCQNALGGMSADTKPPKVITIGNNKQKKL